MGSTHRNPDASAAARGLLPGVPLRGSLRAPGSKSIAQRALLAAALTRGESRLRGLPGGADVRATQAFLTALGIALRVEGPDLLVQGAGPVLAAPGSGARLQAGESGTLARCATALLALCGSPGADFRLAASGSLLRRAHPALWDALGSRVIERGWPTVLRAAPAPAELHLARPSSSQEVSGLLLALAAQAERDGAHTLVVEGPVPSRPYVELTRAVLARFGVRIEARSATPSETAGECFEVAGPLTAATLEIEPDASLAAVALVGACLSGGEITALGMKRDSAQGDTRIAEHLGAFGCTAQWTEAGLKASGCPTRGAELELAGEPDLAPVLAVLAADAATRGHASRLTGLGTLPGKESPRIEVLAQGLRACGWSVSGDADSLAFALGGPAREGGAPVLLDPHGDHRMAFAFALAGLCRAGVSVARPACTAKSWPSFWEDLAGLQSLG